MGGSRWLKGTDGRVVSLDRLTHSARGSASTTYGAVGTSREWLMKEFFRKVELELKVPFLA